MILDRLSEEEKEMLKNNENIKKVNKFKITYSDEFKLEAVKKSIAGIYPTVIFKEAGLGCLCNKGKKYTKYLLKDWRYEYKQRGDSFCDRRRKRKILDSENKD